ncbi:MAG: YihY/virulence factor BrkB family protein [Chitinophagales bacterium]|nr:YihY/virulence factor BrkB family protein [Chitinophagales bacterium]
MHRLKETYELLKGTISSFVTDNVTKLSASLAYYTVFSLGPLMLVVVSVTGVFFETKDVMWKVYWQLKDLVGQSSADQLINIIRELQDKNAGAFSLLGTGILLFGATTVFADMQDSMNYIWSVKAKPRYGWWRYIKTRLLSFSMILGIAFLLMVSLMLSSLINVLSNNLFADLPDELIYIIYLFDFVLSFAVITFLFTCIYKLLPDVVIRWKDALKGAVFTGSLFMLGKYVIGMYIASTEMSNTYGAAASIIVILLWVYYTAIILYFGAEFTKVSIIRSGGKTALKNNAVFIVKQEKELQPW